MPYSAGEAMIRVEVEGGALLWRLLPLCRVEIVSALGQMAEAAYRLGAVDSPDIALDLLLVRDAEIAALNARHMGCVGPTNILSFPMQEEFATGAEPDIWPATRPATGPDIRDSAGFLAQAGDELFLGSLVLGVDTVQREALLYGQEAGEHTLRLLAHGLGHLAGYDHGEDMDELCQAMLDAALLAAGQSSA